MQCARCNNAVLTPLFCDSCNKVLELTEGAKRDYYAFLRMPRLFEISLNNLESQYLIMQLKLHPDRFARKSHEEKAIAAENSALVNIAYAALKNDFARAEHLLSLVGIEIKDESYMQDDMEFLDLAFDLRERAMTDDKEIIAKLRAEVQEMRVNMLRKFARFYESAEYKEAAQLLQKVRFLERFLSEIE